MQIASGKYILQDFSHPVLGFIFSVQAMSAYGFEIVQILIVDIEPDVQVKRAMNEINAGKWLTYAYDFDCNVYLHCSFTRIRCQNWDCLCILNLTVSRLEILVGVAIEDKMNFTPFLIRTPIASGLHSLVFNVDYSD